VCHQRPAKKVNRLLDVCFQCLCATYQVRNGQRLRSTKMVPVREPLALSSVTTTLGYSCPRSDLVKVTCATVVTLL
jgi:hypothetical protein